MTTAADISSRVGDVFDSISVLLVFVSVLFGVRYPEIQKELDGNPPAAGGGTTQKEYQKGILTTFLIRCIPVLVLSGVIAFIFTPLTLDVLRSTDVDLGDFDPILTAFVVICLLLWSLFIWAIVLAIRVFCKWWKA